MIETFTFSQHASKAPPHWLRLLERTCVLWPMATLLLLVFSGCGDLGGPGNGEDPAFAIYLAADTSTKIWDLPAEDLTTLDLSDTPLLTSSDLRLYDFSAHVMYLRDHRSDILPYSSGRESFFLDSWCHRPFLIMAHDVPLYAGQFSCSVSSLIGAMVPEFSDLSGCMYPINTLHIDWDWHTPDLEDPRRNEYVRAALMDAGVFRAGISVRLDSLSSSNDDDLSIVEYTFTLTNNDIDDLFVPDPELMGDALYHYFTNGLVIHNLETGESLGRVNRSADFGLGITRWRESWYTRVPSGTSITRTTVVDAIEQLTPGEYLATMIYQAPATVPAFRVFRNGGRVWLGDVLSEPVGLSIGGGGEVTLGVNDTPRM